MELLRVEVYGAEGLGRLSSSRRLLTSLHAVRRSSWAPLGEALHVQTHIASHEAGIPMLRTS